MLGLPCIACAGVSNPRGVLCLPIFESVIKTVLVTAAHCIILHIVVVFCCFYGTVNSTELFCPPNWKLRKWVYSPYLRRLDI